MCVHLLAIVLGLAIAANDNRVPAGTTTGTQLHVSLDARVAIWHPDGDHTQGIPIQAFAEVGKAPQIPGPLIRVPAGTEIVASVHNSIRGTILMVHGMFDRPSSRDSAFDVPFGKTHIVRFRAAAPGTFFYWGTTAKKRIANRFGGDSQLSGAFIVDPPGAKIVNDRVFVIGQWINVRDKNGGPNFNYELDVINGRAWPHTERLSYLQNATVHWRWINTSQGSHPLHLHGFYFKVNSRGDGIADNVSANSDPEVTELMEPGSTFTMTWHADRPGNWLFHCHLAYHIIGHMPIDAMLAGKSAISDVAYENGYVRRSGMGGLVLGFAVRGSTIAQDPPPHIARHIKLAVEPGPDDRPDAPSFRYVLAGEPAGEQRDAIGPPLILTRGVTTAVDVSNLLHEPTAVHWHGIELADSYYDGVSGYSGNGAHRAPMIDPGQTFEAVMTPPRAGTFIYHTHMDDVWQLRAGLAGPLIVLEPGAKYDPSSDHIFTITTTHSWEDVLKIFVNGTSNPQAVTCRVGTLQRLRFINMSTFWTNAVVSLSAANHTLQWNPLQVDGAYVSPEHRLSESAVQYITIGETRDFTFVARKAGDLELQFWPDPTVPNIVTVPIHVVQ